MRYRAPHEVVLRGRDRVMLTPVPGADGHWLICHPAVVVVCPRCGAESGTPCSSLRGTTVLTAAQAQTAAALADGESVSPSRAQDLRERLRAARFYRSNPHEERKVRWRDAGLANPTRTQGRLRSEVIRSLNRHARRISELAANLKEETCAKGRK
jgi:hypothetical protein